jgi:LmbE family N-acetylglucosaminyl deacetylase
MTNPSEYIPKIAMSIHAHPDDQEFSIGGTLAKWAQAGCEIISVIITSGDSGSNDPARDVFLKTISRKSSAATRPSYSV